MARDMRLFFTRCLHSSQSFLKHPNKDFGHQIFRIGHDRNLISKTGSVDSLFAGFVGLKVIGYPPEQKNNNYQHLWKVSSVFARHNLPQECFPLAKNSPYILNGKRSPAQAFHVQNMSTLRLAIVSPGILLEPYSIRERISIWSRFFTRTGWKRTKEDIMSSVKSTYSLAKLRKLGKQTKRNVYEEVVDLYRKVNTLSAKGDKTSVRHLVTEHMYSVLKKEMKEREQAWSKVEWEMVGPAVRMKTLQARMIAIDKKDLDKAFVQITIEILTNQKFAAFDKKGKLVAGDKENTILVKDVWVVERSLFHSDARWRLCARLSL